jgi:hypothetical protein
MPKPELEFFPADDIPWVPVEGAPPGHYQKILTEDPERMGTVPNRFDLANLPSESPPGQTCLGRRLGRRRALCAPRGSRGRS